MSNLSVRSQANHLASDLDGVANTLDRALEQVAPLESSVAMLTSMLGDVGAPLTSALASLKEIASLRDQADDAAQAQAKSLLDDATRIISNANDRLVTSERYHATVRDEANRLSEVVGSEGTTGCAEALGKAVGRASELYQIARNGHRTLKDVMGHRHESVRLAGQLRKRAKTAEKAVEQACGSVTAACDSIGEFKGAVNTLEIPSPAPLEAVLSQLQALDLASPDPLPDTSELEQLVLRSKKASSDVSELPDTKEIDAKISSAKGKTNHACDKLRAV